MVSTLEKNLRSICHQRMVILKSLCSDDDHSDIVDILSGYHELNALLEIAHLQNSGLTEAGVNELLGIEAETDRFFAAYRVMLVDASQQCDN